jgi:hypothetical protein
VDTPGRVHRRFTTVAEAFASVIAAQPGTGAALAVCCDGRLVVGLWGGYADRDRAARRGQLARNASR